MSRYTERLLCFVNILFMQGSDDLCIRKRNKYIRVLQDYLESREWEMREGNREGNGGGGTFP